MRGGAYLRSASRRVTLATEGTQECLKKIDLENYKDLKVWKWMESPTVSNRVLLASLVEEIQQIDSKSNRSFGLEKLNLGN